MLLMRTTDLLTVGEVARRSGFAPSALRFYETPGTHRGEPDGRQPAPLPAQRAAPAGVHPGRAQRRAEPRRDRPPRWPPCPSGRTPTEADWARLSRGWRDRLDEQIDALRRLRDGLDSCIGCGCLSLRLRDVQPVRRGCDGRSGRGVPAAPRVRVSRRQAVDESRAPGRSGSAEAGSAILEPRSPLPITTTCRSSTAGSTRIGHPSGSPSGVIPPYCMPVSATASSVRAKEAFFAPSRRRTTPLTSARVVASTTHAAWVTRSPRLPAMTTQFAESSRATPYRSQKAAVSARSGSIGAASVCAMCGHAASARATGAGDQRVGHGLPIE